MFTQNIDDEITELQQEINFILKDKKQLTKENEIILKHINLLKQQDLDMRNKCNSQLKKMQDRINKKKSLYENNLNKSEFKKRAQQEQLIKKETIQQQRLISKQMNNYLTYSNNEDNKKELEEKKNKIKEILMQKCNGIVSNKENSF
jgi:hypothetical protein